MSDFDKGCMAKAHCTLPREIERLTAERDGFERNYCLMRDAYAEEHADNERLRAALQKIVDTRQVTQFENYDQKIAREALACKKAADEIERLNGLVALQKKDMKVAMDDNERLRAALVKYGEHDPGNPPVIECGKCGKSLIGTEGKRGYDDGTGQICKALTAVTDEERIYPCDKRGVMQTKAEGGTTFTVCDDCWDMEVKDD